MKNERLIKFILSIIALIIFIVLIFSIYFSYFDTLSINGASQDSKNLIIENIECTNNVQCYYDYKNKSIVIINDENNLIDDFEVNLSVKNKIQSDITISLNIFSNNDVSLLSENLFKIVSKERKNNSYKFKVTNKGAFIITLFYTIEYLPDENNISMYTNYMIDKKIDCKNDDTLYSYICNLSNTNDKNGYYVYQENDKDILYYRGENTNDNVLLGNYCFKVMRTTDNGGVKLLYNGTFDKTNGCDNFDKNNFIGFSPFNLTENSNDDMKYMVGDNNSTIKNYVDKWYEDNFKGTYVEDILDFDAVFCNDFSIAPTNITLIDSPNIESKNIFDSFSRISEFSRIFKPSLNCPLEDSYSVNRGNKKLIYPIGLISADEAFMGQTNEESFYLAYNNYWTMTPFYSAHIKNFDRNYMAFVTAGGRLNYVTITDNLGIRPTVVVRGDVKITKGDGSMLRPFSIE